MVERQAAGATMVGAAAARARALLVEGYAIEVDGGTHRVFPSHAEVARQLGVPTSTVTRWAKRAAVSAERAQVVARDRRHGAAPRPTIAALVAVVVQLAEMRLHARRSVSSRDRARLERLLRWLVDGDHGTSGTVAMAERLLVSLSAPRRAT